MSTVWPYATGLYALPGWSVPGGITPTTSYGCASSRILRPRISGAAANWVRQSAVAQNDDRRSASQFIVVSNSRPRRSQSQYAEKSGRHAECAEFHRLARARQLNVPARVSGDALEAVIGRANVAQVEMVDRELVEARVVIENARHPVGRGVGKRLGGALPR